MSRFFMVHCVRSKILQFYTQICIWIRPRIELYCFLDVNLYIFFLFSISYTTAVTLESAIHYDLLKFGAGIQ